MAIKIICDICGREAQDDDFAFEATKMEFTTSLTGGLLNPQKQMKKELIQVCKECYYKDLEKLFKYGNK